MVNGVKDTLARVWAALWLYVVTAYRKEPARINYAVAALVAAGLTAVGIVALPIDGIVSVVGIILTAVLGGEATRSQVTSPATLDQLQPPSRVGLMDEPDYQESTLDDVLGDPPPSYP